MPSNKQTHTNDKTNSKQRSPKPAAGNFDPLPRQQPYAITLIQRAKVDPGALTPGEVLQLQREIGNRAVDQLLDHAPVQSERTVNEPGARPAPGTEQASMAQETAAIQRAFHPAITNTKDHLRSRSGTGDVLPSQKTGPLIPSGTEIVVDDAQQKVQHRKIRKNVTWTRGVGVTGSQWDPATHPNQGGFIRDSIVNDKAYPESVTLNLGSRGQLALEKHWHEAVGEYIVVENSIQTPADEIVKVGANFWRMDAGHALHALTALEQTQVNDVSREDAAQNRLGIILTNAATAGGIDPALLATPENVEKLKHPLRMEQATGSQRAKNKWNTWAQAVFAKIGSGAADLVASLNHWKTQLSPLDPTQCTITRIKLEGSDLHDRGLGAVFVDFTKPLGGAIFANQTNVTTVIKPEDRNIEKSLFGQQATSLANRVNVLANLAPNDSITQIEMETHANFGSIIEFVQGQQARAINGTGADTQAMSEGIAFAFLAGLSDVHQDNVLWHNGKPYFIDADNALNASRLQTPTSQTGFSAYNPNRTTTDIDALANNPNASRSAIIQALLANSTPLLAAVQQAYAGKTGRVVPLYTNYWAAKFTLGNYIELEDGAITDGTPAGVNRNSRWRSARYAINKLRVGEDDRLGGPGLIGETGISSAGEFFDQATEIAQIKADLDQGKVPFYTYNYTTGHVLHNGQVIWHGQSLADAMLILQAKFPPP